jgi:hypothetical protein
VTLRRLQLWEYRPPGAILGLGRSHLLPASDDVVISLNWGGFMGDAAAAPSHSPRRRIVFNEHTDANSVRAPQRSGRARVGEPVRSRAAPSAADRSTQTFSLRLQVSPGLTGLAQISGGKLISVEDDCREMLREHNSPRLLLL